MAADSSRMRPDVTYVLGALCVSWRGTRLRIAGLQLRREVIACDSWLLCSPGLCERSEALRFAVFVPNRKTNLAFLHIIPYSWEKELGSLGEMPFKL